MHGAIIAHLLSIFLASIVFVMFIYLLIRDRGNK